MNDGGNSDGDTDSDKDLAGRLFYEPFRNRKGSFFEGLGVGVGGSVGEQHDPLSAALHTAGRSQLFRYRQAAGTGAGATPGAEGAGIHTRIAPGFHFYRGQFGAIGEYIRSSQEVERGGISDRVTNDGWFLQTTYFLTGEKPGFRNIAPRRPFDPAKGQWGAFEIGLRYSQINFDSRIFRNNFANAQNSVGDAYEWTFGLNWYLSGGLRLQLYIRTDFDRSLLFGNHLTDHEEIFISRFELVF